MKPLRIALYQGPAGVPRDTAVSLDALDEAAGRAAAGGAGLLAAAEMYLTGYAVDAPAAVAEPADGPGARRVAAIAARHGIAVVYGYPERDGDAVYNSAQLIGPDGTRLANYRKTHLFGDFESAHFRPGDTPVVQAELGGLTVGLLICYDVEFPEAVRAHALAGTDLLLVPTALMRPYDFVPLTLVPARAYESQLYVAYANRCGPEGEFDFTGLSCLSAPDGVTRARAGAGPDLVFGDADPALLAASRTELPYLRDRRAPLYRSLV
ncbi:carbon-nitrogen hydrolase family protein [Streptantibioticus silvisoli]|jgi:predicted amidohydrolase|uniref:Carbon-nitrogen hydrolase family protein n=1 Tax=Streptantibioticus silvisoli TaxID=2705255 RepID=A0ABT6W1W4_9ACTN|nr:carbon-nitrogen hydrolase family protein [Streptantibioticus silvisoli]MDI5964732.1 carbon-nitrogen hydrolase family protein [Streptantibioticus silvisoli]